MPNTVAGIHLGLDTHANRPAATAVPAGSLYSCSDHSLIYRSDGSTWATWATLGAGAGGTLIEEIVLAVDTAAFTFDAIPATSKDLLLIGMLRSDNAALAEVARMRVGATSVDTGTNYESAITLFGDSDFDTSVEAQTGIDTISGGAIVGDTATAGHFAVVEWRILNYTDIAQYRHVMVTATGKRNATSSRHEKGIGIWKNTADAIDIITVAPTAGSNWKTGSRLALYGMG